MTCYHINTIRIFKKKIYTVTNYARRVFKSWSILLLDTKFLKLNIEELIDWYKLYTTVRVAMLQGRSFKRKTN